MCLGRAGDLDPCGAPAARLVIRLLESRWADAHRAPLWNLTVFSGRLAMSRIMQELEIGRLLSIVAETEKIVDRRNSPLNSGARIFDGSARRFFAVRRNNFACRSMRYRCLKSSSGSRGNRRRKRGLGGNVRYHASVIFPLFLTLSAALVSLSKYADPI